MIAVPDFIDETGDMTSSIHANSWNWNAHSSFCRRAATCCGLRRGG